MRKWVRVKWGRWVPVEERLPGRGAGPVIVYAPSWDQFNATVAEYFREKQTWLLLGYHVDLEVTHWMPLPEPPDAS